MQSHEVTLHDASSKKAPQVLVEGGLIEPVKPPLATGMDNIINIDRKQNL